MTWQRLELTEFSERYGLDTGGTWKSAIMLVNPGSDGPWIVGGLVRRMIDGKPQSSDVDVAFQSAEQLTAVKDRLIDGGFKIRRETEHHIELAGQLGEGKDKKIVPVQLLRVAYYKSCEEALDSFDFTICQFGFDGSDIICGPYSMWDLARKRLAIHKVTFGASTFRRALKYSNQGYTLCSGAITALLQSVAENPSIIHSEIQYVD